MGLKVEDLFAMQAGQQMKRPAQHALGRLPKDQMNKSEREYSERLQYQLLSKSILYWRFQGVGLRMADRTFYYPDFLVMSADGTLEIHEVKGFMEDDAHVKIKTAAEMFPFRFFIAWVPNKKNFEDWKIEPVG